MADVAARVGVSRQLVSLVFRDAAGASLETRERVFQAAAELGYRPDNAARLLSSTRSRHLGVLFTLQQPFDLDVVEHIYPAAERLGYTVVLGAMSTTRDQRQAVQELFGYRIEGLIVMGPENRPGQLTTLAEGIPVVEIGRRTRDSGLDVVRINDTKGMALAVDHLVAYGHRDIVHIDGGPMPGGADRRRGYRTAMRRHGLEQNVRVIPGDYTEESGARAVHELRESSALPTAIIAGNDRCASGALFSLIRSGVQVPDDVSIVGYDDSRAAALPYVELTTVRQDATRLADLAVQAIAERLDDEQQAGRDIVFDPTLVVRGTTGPAPAR